MLYLFVSPPLKFPTGYLLRPLPCPVRQLLQHLYSENLLTGAQVCVYKDGVKLVDTCAGTMGLNDPRSACAHVA